MDRGVDLNLMRYLAVLLREQSVTRAAEKLDVSQPAVSAALSRLRSLLDDELMVRGPSGISLTPRAQELVAHSEEFERVVDRILGSDETFDPKKSERCFAIQSTDFIQWLLAPRLAAAALSEAPKVTFRFLQPDPLHIEKSMSAGTLDLGIGYLPSCPPNLLQHHVMTDHYICLLRRAHPIFKSKAGMDLESFTKYPHVQILPRDFIMYSAPIDAALANVNATRRVGVWLPSFLVLPHVIACTDMIAVVPSKMAAGTSSDTALATIDPPILLPHVPFYMYWHPRSARDKGLHWLRKAVAKIFREHKAKLKLSRGLSLSLK
jgi:DNA-binding transcriptional LysR family regulator